MSRGRLRFAWRGFILAACFLILAVARYRSDLPLQPGGLLLVALAMALRLEAGRHIGAHSNGDRMEAGAGGFAATGPYAYSRHPLYLSNLMAAAGLLVFAHCLPAWGMAALFLAVALHHRSLARAEEAHLLSVHGEAYRRYLQVTPRWLGPPRRGPRASGAALAEAWRRQGANLAKTGASALALWALALA